MQIFKHLTIFKTLHQEKIVRYDKIRIIKSSIESMRSSVILIIN